MTKRSVLRIRKNETGSLALEQVLFIGAIVALSAGIYAFYDNINDYFANFSAGANQTVPTPGDTINNN